MADNVSANSFYEVVSELERLVEVWKNLGNSHMNFESITDLITQKLVGLRAFSDFDLYNTSLQDFGRLIDLRNKILELNICSRNYSEHWGILDACLKKMITFLNPYVGTSDLQCLEILEEWATLCAKMTKYRVTSPESSGLLHDIVGAGLNDLRVAFEDGLGVKNDADSMRVLENSMRVLEIAAKLRGTLTPQFHMWIDEIIAQKLRILSIRQVGKSDLHLNDTVQSVQNPGAFPEEQENAPGDYYEQEIGFSNGDSEGAVSNEEMDHLESNHQDLSMVSSAHDRGQASHNPPPVGLDEHTLDACFPSLLPGVTARENELKQEKEESDRSTQELVAENRDLNVYIETYIKTLEEDFRKEKGMTATMRENEAWSELRIRHLMEDHAQIKEELRQMTEAYEDRKTHDISLCNELVEERQSQFTQAVKINELKEEMEGLTKELQDAKASVDQTKVDLLSISQTIRNLRDEVAGLQQALSDDHDSDDEIYDESFQSRVEELTEELAEAEEDKAALARHNDRLVVEKASAEESLAESEDSKIAVSNELLELLTKNERLEQELKDASDSLEEAEDDRATLSRSVKKLTSEKIRLGKELAAAQDILRQISSFSSSIQPMATESALQEANANDDADTDTSTSSTGTLTPTSSA